MTTQINKLPWDMPGWQEDVTTWIAGRLAEKGLRATGPVEIVHQRPWSAFVRQPTDQGLVHFKAPAPMYAHEVPLTETMLHLRPDLTLPLLGSDAQRGWMLSADAGVTFRALGQTTEQLQHWEVLLPLYAELQIQLAPHVTTLLSHGVPDRRLAAFPVLYGALLDDEAHLMIGQELGLTAEQHHQLRELEQRLTEECAQLEELGLPDTLVHEEIHENNVLFGERGYTLTDWSDSSIGHPFFTMIVTVRSIAHWLKLDEFGPELARVRDAYLEPWTGFASRERLNAGLEVALRLGMVNRSLSWHHCVAALAPELGAEYADNVPGWLQDYLIAHQALTL